MISEERQRIVAKRLLIERQVESPKVCTVCGKRAVLPVTSKEDAVGLVRWAYRRVPVQTALPHWSADMREVLISGTHPACWTELFGNEEEE